MGRPRSSLIGMRFGKLVVVGIGQPVKNAGAPWLCKCDCGVTTEVSTGNLRLGKTQSCGCLHRQLCIDRSTKHGMSGHRLYGVFKNIRNRCNNPLTPAYVNYGGRGIKCLFKDAEEFINWAMANGYKDGLTIDRIDNDGSYSAENCRFVGTAEQSRNRRNNRYVVIDGEKLCFKDAASHLGINYKTAMKRLQYGWSTESALGM